MEQNKTGKYFKYAIGEIILVVIGILIALQINNWNEERKEQKLEQNYVALLTQDLRSDAENLTDLVKVSDKIANSKYILLDYFDGKIEKPDSLSIHFLRAIFSSIHNFVPNKGAIEEVKNAGGLSLIKDEVLRSQILKLYNAYDSMEKNTGKNYVENRNVMRDLVYEKTNGRMFITHEIIDQNLLNNIIKDNEIQNRLVNNFALSYNQELKELLQLNIQTIEVCNDYLQQFND
jgi:hypothetical protein